jgi:hypothetical protein
MKKLQLFHPYIWMLFGLFSVHCAAQKKFNFDKMPKNQLVFGAGGGFGGTVSEFCLLEDGQLYEKTATTQYQRLKTIDKKLTKSYFARLDSLQLRHVIFNQPGDIYYYITIRRDKMDEYKILWGKADRPVRADIQRFYDTLLKLLPKGKAMN